MNKTITCPGFGTRFFRVITGLILTLGFTASVQATPITGDPQGNGFGWVPASTNALNAAQLTPGYIGDLTSYVLFNSNAPGSVTLDFFGPYAGIAFFESRLDGIPTGVDPHPIVTGDTIHTGGVFVGTLGAEQQTFFATQYVDIRLALGGERDWDFDWTRFEVLPESVPEPSAIALLGLGLMGLVLSRRRRIA